MSSPAFQKRWSPLLMVTLVMLFQPRKLPPPAASKRPNATTVPQLAVASGNVICAEFAIWLPDGAANAAAWRA